MRGRDTDAAPATLEWVRRHLVGLRMARLGAVKTLDSFDFSFQPSLDRGRVQALAQLGFVDRREVPQLLGPPGTGKSHLAVALGVEAVRAGRSVYFMTLADLITALARAERDGSLRERIRFLCRFLCRPQLLIVDEIGYLPATTSSSGCPWCPRAATCFFNWSTPAMSAAP